MINVTSVRSLVDELLAEDRIIRSNQEIDPRFEITGALKALEGGPAVLFENIKGYPGQRIFGNPFSTNERVCKLFGASDLKNLKHAGLSAFKSPVSAKEIGAAPSQEVVIRGEEVDVLSAMPIPTYTETDPGRILGGLVLLSGDDIGSCLSYKRLHFQGKDWASLAFIPGSHFEHWVLARRKAGQNLPLTINVSPPPAVMAVAAGGGIPSVIPAGSDELAMAGGLQGRGVNICRAKTIAAMALADAEWVIEGYVDTSARIAESELRARDPEAYAPFFPEWHGHEGEAEITYKFVATGITRRRDDPIFDVWLAHSLQLPNIVRLVNDGVLLEYLDRLSPGVITDVNALDSMKQLGLVIQVKKRFRRDDALVRNLILAAFSLSVQLRLVIVVDSDVDIYNADEIIWAMNTRLDAQSNMIVIPDPQHGRRVGGPLKPVARVGLDLTGPKAEQQHYWRGEYPAVDLRKWFTDAEISKAISEQGEYARLLAAKRV
ncbi:4-hydroxy-3-polyprenylbenzoate decarboxylase [Steroidobacter denitrificans]|uniref:4-hydroxy-3-polyprenylbenzoate decarboxylase n=1 Tax=Steroidobacter denitrificans TaxID=465721 RepID=A0A127FB84_STEDE|nr:UbiD family decarboxylase [Steroidobacter denitrificans]AMN47683.1 4-hydroxy-3-polyprenylbenzoate decarboxylase [Steroidobacter denitrificans]